MNDLRKTLVNDLNDVETALCALEGVKPGTIRQNGYTGDFKGVMAYPVLLVQKGREKGMTDYTKLVKELRGCKYIDYCKDCPRMAANGYVEICNIKDDAAAAIEALVKRVKCAAAPRWHRVKDGLPPKATWVLTVATEGNVKLFNIATVDAGGQWWTCSPQNILRELYGVRYWMPIEPPKEEEHGN